MTAPRLTASERVARGDKPRKIVLCSYDEYPQIQRGVAALGHGDVLVKPSRLVETGKAYVLDGSALHPDLPPWPWEAR